MQNSLDENTISNSVEKEFKKDGIFDKLRKQAIENINSTDKMKELDAEMKQRVENIVKSAPLDAKEVGRLVRAAIDNDSKLRNEIGRQARSEMNQQWFQDMLTKELDQKTKQILDGYRDN